MRIVNDLSSPLKNIVYSKQDKGTAKMEVQYKSAKTAMKDFRTSEMKKLRQTRNVMIVFLLMVNLSVLSFFVYMFYSVYTERQISEPSFPAYILPTISYIQVILSLTIGPLIWIGYRRFRRFTDLLKALDQEHMALYESYIKRLMRIAGAGIAPYVFTADKLIVPGLLSDKEIPYNAIVTVKVSRIWSGNPFKYRVKVKLADGRKYYFSFIHGHHLDFLISNLRSKNSNITFVQPGK